MNDNDFLEPRIAQSMQRAAAAGVLPSPDFLSRCEKAAERGFQRRKVLEKLMGAIENSQKRIPLLFSEAVLDAANAADVSDKEALFALGFGSDDSFDLLDQPSRTTAEATRLMCIPTPVARQMMQVGCLEMVLASRNDGQGADYRGYPSAEAERRITAARVSGDPEILARLSQCEHDLNRYFPESED